MGTHGYFNIRGYPHSGYLRGYWADTGIIFIQLGGDEYHSIRTHGYPLTSLRQPLPFLFLLSGQQQNLSQKPNSFPSPTSHFATFSSLSKQVAHSFLLSFFSLKNMSH